MRKGHSDLCGLLVVDKPRGWSSMDVVRRVRRAAGGVKTGHAGTLDPLATGVVVCCLGPATKAVDRIMQGVKVYDATADLSAFTTTDDREGERTEVALDKTIDREAIARALPEFVGMIQQTPPAFSAVHVDGKRAYKLARRGETLELAPRTVRVDGIELIRVQLPLVDLHVTCGKGVYIRSLARDLGKRLGTGGHLAALRRTRVGDYDIAMAVDERRLQTPINQEDLLPTPA